MQLNTRFIAQSEKNKGTKIIIMIVILVVKLVLGTVIFTVAVCWVKHTSVRLEAQSEKEGSREGGGDSSSK